MLFGLLQIQTQTLLRLPHLVVCIHAYTNNQTMGKTISAQSMCRIAYFFFIQFTFVPIHTHTDRERPKYLYRSFDCCSRTIVYGAYGYEHMAKTALDFIVNMTCRLSVSLSLSLWPTKFSLLSLAWNKIQPNHLNRSQENIKFKSNEMKLIMRESTHKKNSNTQIAKRR